MSAERVVGTTRVMPSSVGARNAAPERLATGRCAAAARRTPMSASIAVGFLENFVKAAKWRPGGLIDGETREAHRGKPWPSRDLSGAGASAGGVAAPAALGAPGGGSFCRNGGGGTSGGAGRSAE